MSRHQHHHPKPHPHPEARPKPFHRSPLFIVAVILMLIAMVVYVLTMDESVVSVPEPGQPATMVPASP